ncbi:EMC6-like membrane protein [Methanospirillum lacunae]|uniref:Uncharacterized protein n=1 Tax=Methanospirillum lacunae TaxID=668570 RepID=A0A2V2NBN0_9EURY|nr:hypothetical protein [Methanospirillum lacunae]PWR72981.1 hypothetical protein DK846_05745 [Methanospirillum lacunae]
MTEESLQTAPESIDAAPVSVPEPDDYTGRIIRTIIAVVAGFFAGLICFMFEGMATQSAGSSSGIFAILVLIAAIMIQKHVFMALRLRYTLEKKDWFYQGFMTFSFWFVTWTILLTGTAMNAA